MHTNQVVCKSHVSPMPFNFRLWMLSWCGDKCLDIMLPSVGDMVTSPCSAENRSQAQISNSLYFLHKTSVLEGKFHNFVRCFPVRGQLLLFFSKANEVVLIYLIKYEQCEVVFQNIRKLYRGVLHDRSCNSLRKLP